MQITWRELSDANQALSRLGNQKLPYNLAFKIAKLQVIVRKALRTGETSRLNEAKAVKKEYESKLKELKANITLSKEELAVEEASAKEELNEKNDQLLEQILDVEGSIDKLILPSHISYTCDKCKQVTSREWEVEPIWLASLDRFIKES